MTVAELIQRLQQIPDGLTVGLLVEGNFGEDFVPVRKVTVHTERDGDVCPRGGEPDPPFVVIDYC